MDANVALELMKGIAELCKANIITANEARDALKRVCIIDWKKILVKNDIKIENKTKKLEDNNGTTKRK